MSLMTTNTHVSRRCLQHPFNSLLRPKRWMSSNAGTGSSAETDDIDKEEEEWQYLLPLEDWTHNSSRITIPSKQDDNDVVDDTFLDRLHATVVTLKELKKSSVWVDVHISQSRLLEDMATLGFQFHHAQGENAVLNLWLKDDSPSLVPEFATHHIGVGGLVINSRNEVLLVREGRQKNHMPWKIPGGLSDLGEHIDEAAIREVLEETGIRTTFRNVLCFRHTHGLANGRSDLYFVCRLDPIDEQVDDEGNVVIPEPVPCEVEIAATAWVPYSEFRALVDDEETGHPMISHVLDLNDREDVIERNLIKSILPGRKPTPIYSSPSSSEPPSRIK